MRKNRAIICLITLLASSTPQLFLSQTVWAWGPEGHTLITKSAIALLPKEMKGFYETNASYLTALTMLPDDWRQTHWNEMFTQHFIDLDQFDQPPFDKIRTGRATVEKRFGRDKVLNAGIVPWVIEERYGKLVAAFKSRDMEEVVLQSSLLAHFVGDSHVPFHATKDYDGRKLEQKGIHTRWESEMVILRLKPESIRPTSPAKIDDILKSAFDWCVDSYSYVDTICAADDAARAKDPTHTYAYYNILWEKTGDIAEKRLTQAAEDLAGTWLTAWKAAGSPDLKEKAAPLFWGR
jgi:hypothetical protein